MACFFTNHLPHRHWVFEAFQTMLTKISEIKQATYERTCALRDNDGVGFGKRLQSRCQIGRFANCRPFVCAMSSDEVPHHYDAGGDAYTRLERNSIGQLEIGNRFYDIQSRTDRSLGVISLCLWITKVDQHTITQVSSDITA